MRFRLRTLLMVLVLITSQPGCRDRKVEQLQRGAEGVERHAKEIEDAAATQP
jgi:hypothetical protein